MAPGRCVCLRRFKLAKHVGHRTPRHLRPQNECNFSKQHLSSKVQSSVMLPLNGSTVVDQHWGFGECTRGFRLWLRFPGSGSYTKSRPKQLTLTTLLQGVSCPAEAGVAAAAEQSWQPGLICRETWMPSLVCTNYLPTKPNSGCMFVGAPRLSARQSTKWSWHNSRRTWAKRPVQVQNWPCPKENMEHRPGSKLPT